jgi:cyclopropane-fatty-acyl-phospholipid synthase
MAERFPKSSFTVVSNSASQKEYIDKQSEHRGLQNLNVITADINHFQTDQTFDRVVSVEMFEHMHNYELLFSKIAGFLKEEGKLFVHVFCHKTLAYKFYLIDESDWMSKYFFTGGIMPSDNLLLYFNEQVQIEQHWCLNGSHYSKTSEAWLKNMDAHKDKIMPLFETTYGIEQARKWWVYWRIFFMACAELWGYKKGEEWLVSHYLFKKKTALI